MITVIGTGHIFQLSQILLSLFDEKQPEVIAVELDRHRYRSLLMKHANPDYEQKERTRQPFLYRYLGRFQQDLAKQFGVTAGEEMLTAILYAQSHQLPCACIDMDAQRVFSRMFQTMPMTEKIRFLLSGLGGLFVSHRRLEKEITKLENNVDSYMDEVAKVFPTIQTVLIDQRNEFMVQQLCTLQKDHQRIVAVVGDGHVPGIQVLLQQKNVPVEVIRLAELRTRNQTALDPTHATFQVTYDEQVSTQPDHEQRTN
jgi:pheromone shutdown protein TraB